MGAARIGKIRLKAGGAEVRVLHQDTPNLDGEENWAGKLITSARGAAEHVADSGPIRGYVLIAFFEDQSTYTAYRWTDESPFNRALLPGYVAEVARRDILTDPEATRIVNLANGYEPD